MNAQFSKQSIVRVNDFCHFDTMSSFSPGIGGVVFKRARLDVTLPLWWQHVNHFT